MIQSMFNPLLTNGLSVYCSLTVCFLVLNCCDLIVGQSTDVTIPVDDKSDPFIIPWSSLNVTCENGLNTWNSCLNEALTYWSSVNDEDKRDCCASWHLFNCWSYQVKIVCSDIDPTLLEQSKLLLSNQTRCIKYYDLSVCMAKPLPVWANILILSFGATLITGAAIFVYWRWIRLI